MAHMTLDLVKIHKPRIRNDAHVIQITLEVESGDLYTVNMPTESVGNIAGQLMKLFMTTSEAKVVRAKNNQTSTDTNFTTIPDVHHIEWAQIIAHEDGSMDIKAVTEEFKDLLIVFPDGALQGLCRDISPMDNTPPTLESLDVN